MVISYDNLEDFFGMQIDLLCLLRQDIIPKKLSGKPKKFFVYCIILTAEGYDINSTDAVEKLRDYMGFKINDDVYTYRYKLKSQGWLVAEKNNSKRFKILPMFDFQGKDLRTLKDYKFQLKYATPAV